MAAKCDLDKFYWMFPPQKFNISCDAVTIVTDPMTDFWQRTYYGFRHDNAHCFLIPLTDEQFSFSVHCCWKPKNLFDQCGVVLYQNADNWFKASVEYENKKISRLGSVVTNMGYSDWATTDVDAGTNAITYRLSRRGQDFLIENSADEKNFFQMRIFHMHVPLKEVNIGVYGCSPLDSSMEAKFSHFKLEECRWELYTN